MKIDRVKAILYKIVLITISLILATCGKNSNVFSPETNYDPELIVSLINSDNRFELITAQPVIFRLSYRNAVSQEYRYNGYSTGSASSKLSFRLPVQNIEDIYQLKLTVYSESSFKDTLVYFQSEFKDDEFLRVDYVDVKQGDGTYIRTPEGISLAIDGGYGSYSPGWAPGESWNGAGVPYLLNYVREQEVENFSYLIETHRHRDHWGGLQDLIDYGYTYDRYLSTQYAYGYKVGDFLNLDSEVNIQILNLGYAPGLEGTGINNTSIALRIVFGSTEFLFTGDAEQEVENYLIRSDFDISANVLKAGHHGSKTSSTPQFLNRVLNQFAKVVTLSFGTGNPYGHPHDPERFKNYETYGTNRPSGNYSGSNYYFDVGTIKTYTDGIVLVVRY